MEGSFRASDLNDPSLRVIETLGWDGACLRHAERHLARARQTCAKLGFRYDPAAVETALSAVGGADPLRVRLTLGAQGDAEVKTAALSPAPTVWRIGISPHLLDARDPWLAIKTTRRALYDRTRAALPAGVDEVLFLNAAGEVCEGTITNLFFDIGYGLCTPPLRCGLLPGVLRGVLLAQGKCREAVLPQADLTHASLWVGSSLRGLSKGRIALETLQRLPHKRT